MYASTSAAGSVVAGITAWCVVALSAVSAFPAVASEHTFMLTVHDDLHRTLFGYLRNDVAHFVGCVAEARDRSAHLGARCVSDTVRRRRAGSPSNGACDA